MLLKPQVHQSHQLLQIKRFSYLTITIKLP